MPREEVNRKLVNGKPGLTPGCVCRIAVGIIPKSRQSFECRLQEPLIKWDVATPWSALAWQRFVRLTDLARIIECCAAAGQSGAGPPHSKELMHTLVRAFCGIGFTESYVLNLERGIIVHS